MIKLMFKTIIQSQNKNRLAITIIMKLRYKYVKVLVKMDKINKI